MALSDPETPESMSGRRIFVASLGNASSAYKNTFHSAGHTVIEAIRPMLASSPFMRERSYGNGLISHGNYITLWQSPSLMNTSGKALAPAWNAFLKDLSMNEERLRAKLVILHDDLDGQLGKIKVKVGGSARGHNGIKDCMLRLRGTEFTRIGIGISRPESRESSDVAAYVLSKMKPDELEKIEDAAGPVLKILNDMSEG